jgi:DNA adenine methylase
VKPLIKWAGGKRQIAAELFSRFPPDWNQGTYLEPFIGGGAMFLHVAPKKAVVADLNSRLYGFYLQVKSNPEKLYSGVVDIADEFNATDELNKKDFYLSLRTKYNESSVDSFESAILLYVLNKLCFNGLYRENSKGGFNVPFGQKKHLAYIDEEDLNAVSKALEVTEIINADFETTIGKAKPGDFVYLDPPYIPIDTTSSFTSYHSNGFGIAEQQRLATAMVLMKNAGIRAMCSNSDTPLTREIFTELNIEAIQAPRMVSAKASGRGSVSELVITNYK